MAVVAARHIATLPRTPEVAVARHTGVVVLQPAALHRPVVVLHMPVVVNATQTAVAWHTLVMPSTAAADMRIVAGTKYQVAAGRRSRAVVVAGEAHTGAGPSIHTGSARHLGHRSHRAQWCRADPAVPVVHMLAGPRHTAARLAAVAAHRGRTPTEPRRVGSTLLVRAVNRQRSVVPLQEGHEVQVGC